MSTHPTRSFEFVAVRGASRELLGRDWPIAAGAVSRSPSGGAALLHFAPGRWLAPDPEAGLAARLDALVNAGAGLLADVTGKWQSITLPHAGAARVLAAGVALDAVLAERGCAALWLFDCPVVLARAGERFDLWVQSSYAPSLIAALESVRTRIAA